MEERASLLTYKTMQEKKEAIETSGKDTKQKNDEEDARILEEMGDNSCRRRDKKDIAFRVLTRLRSNSSLFGDEDKAGRKSSLSTAVSTEGK